jgi:hypothetical protein
MGYYNAAMELARAHSTLTNFYSKKGGDEVYAKLKVVY